MDLEELAKRFAILLVMSLFLLLYTTLYNSYQKMNNPQPYPCIEKHFYEDTSNSNITNKNTTQD